MVKDKIEEDVLKEVSKGNNEDGTFIEKDKIINIIKLTQQKTRDDVFKEIEDNYIPIPINQRNKFNRMWVKWEELKKKLEELKK